MDRSRKRVGLLNYIRKILGKVKEHAVRFMDTHGRRVLPAGPVGRNDTILYFQHVVVVAAADVLIRIREYTFIHTYINIMFIYLFDLFPFISLSY